MVRIDTMLVLRNEAVRKVNEYYNAKALEFTHRDHAYTAKREAARKVSELPAKHPLVLEAIARGIHVDDLAKTVLGKPNTIETRELERQKCMLAIDRAQTPEELKQVLSKIPNLRV